VPWAAEPAHCSHQSVTAGKTPATLATWYVDDIDQIVDELVSSGVEFIRYDQFEHDAKGITAVRYSSTTSRPRSVFRRSSSPSGISV
jgi:hypothetical protein